MLMFTDIRKAFDTVSFEAFTFSLQAMGFVATAPVSLD